MKTQYSMIATAVAAAVAGTTYSATAGATPPSLSQAAAPTISLVMAGSSAAKSAISYAIGHDVCGSTANMLTITGVANASSTTPAKNFLAYSCYTPSGGIGSVPGNTLVTIYYRTEGGSVVGAIPVATGVKINRLNLSDASCTEASTTAASATCTITGTTTANGPADSWGGAVTTDYVQLGLTDVEPAQLTGTDYPTTYTNFGTATAQQMAGLPKIKIMDQVFGMVINPSGIPLSAGVTGFNLSKESVVAILSGKVSDWALIPDAVTGKPIASASTTINIINREPGSGTRAATNMYFFNYQCGSTSSIPVGSSNYYSTTDELEAASTTASSIAYASIDQIQNPANFSSWNNLVLATINGQTPSNLAAATGAYDFWYEATLVPNAAQLSGNSLALANYLETDIPKLSALPAVPDVLAIPGVAGNTAATTSAGLANNGGSGTTTVYVNPYSRNGNSCNVPATTL